MVKIIILARKTDGLIFCENTDECVEDRNLQTLVKKTKEMLLKFKDKNGDCSLSIDSNDYMIHYKTEQNIVYLILTNKSYSQKLAFCLLDELNQLFLEELKNFFGFHNVDYFSKLESLDRENVFIKFEKVLKKIKNKYENEDSNDNLEKIKKDILDVHQIVNENISLLLDRERFMESANTLSSTMKGKSHDLYKKAKETRYSLMFRKYALIGSILGFAILFIVLKLYV